MRLTNAQRANVIDALKAAIDLNTSLLESNLPPFRRDWTKDDRADFTEWTMQKKEWTKLRRQYLAEEKAQ